ncbi:MAG: chloride channel protein [Haloarculaceae archaeon]
MPGDERGASVPDRTAAGGWLSGTPFSRALSLPENEEVRLNLVAIAIGVVAGLGAVGFRLTIWLFQELFYGTALNPGNVEFELVQVPNVFSLLAPLGALRYVLIPALGGLLVGLVITLTTSAVSGRGVSYVMEAMLVKGGRINPRIFGYKTIASSIAIGSGASLGREGPIIQIGSAAGSYFGRFLDSQHTRTLVAAGAAAGIAATFNTPIAGVMFALEILLAEYYLRHVIVVVLSAVIATAVARPLLEFTPSPGVREFLVPVSYHLVTPIVEMPLYMLLGVVVALVGGVLVKVLFAVEHFFDRLDVPGYTKPAVGGALLGVSVLLAAVVFGVDSLQAATWLFGVGYNTIHGSITGTLTLGLLSGLAILKVVGFSLSSGSGTSGGAFSPTLFVGAMVGGAFGTVVHAIVPGTAQAGAYALVGMGGVFAASASAPLTATIVIFELTGQYEIILPLLTVAVIGSEVANVALHRGSIYTEKLRDHGLTVQERRIGSLEDLTAKSVMTSKIDTIPAGTALGDALEHFRAVDHHGLPIVDEENRLVGIIVLSDLQRGLNDYVSAALENCGDPGVENAETPVEEIGTTDPITVTPETNLLNIVDLMEAYDIGRIPVIDDEERLCGIVTRSDVLDAYDDIPSDIRSRIRKRERSAD